MILQAGWPSESSMGLRQPARRAPIRPVPFWTAAVSWLTLRSAGRTKDFGEGNLLIWVRSVNLIAALEHIVSDCSWHLTFQLDSGTNASMFYVTATFIAIAVVMQVASVRKIEEASRISRGAIRSRRDLLLVRAAINLSMRLAIVYIGLFVVFIVVLALSVLGGKSVALALLSLFIFGVVTLPIGLVGKKYEKKIRTMGVESDDPQLRERFESYLAQWDKPKIQLSD